MKKSLGEYMADLKDDLQEFRRRRVKISQELERLGKQPPSEKVLTETIELDSNLTHMYEVVKIVFKNIMGDDFTEAELLGYLVSRGLILEMAKFSKVRDRLYTGFDFGNVQQLPEEERRIAELEPPRIDAIVERAKRTNTLTDLFEQGYIMTRCPECRQPAGWNEDEKHLLCLTCGHSEHYERRPGPKNAEA